MRSRSVAISGSLSRNTSSGTKPCLTGIAVSSVILDAVRNVQLIVHLAQVMRSEELPSHRVVLCRRGFMKSAIYAVALLRGLVLCIKGDNLRKIHRICSAVDDMCTVISKSSAGLVSHGMNDAKQSVGECHTGQALCVMHVASRLSISPL